MDYSVFGGIYDGDGGNLNFVDKYTPPSSKTMTFLIIVCKLGCSHGVKGWSYVFVFVSDSQ